MRKYQVMITVKETEVNGYMKVVNRKMYTFYMFHLIFFCLTLKRLGGGGGACPPPPSTFRVITLQRAKLSPRHFMTFSFKFPAHFDTIFVMPGGTVLKLRNFLYMHVGPKMAPKCDFVYKINAN